MRTCGRAVQRAGGRRQAAEVLNYELNYSYYHHACRAYVRSVKRTNVDQYSNVHAAVLMATPPNVQVEASKSVA